MKKIATARACGWQVAVHDRIGPLEAEWRDLEDRGLCTLFQSFDWLSVLYEVIERHQVAEPVIVTAKRTGQERTEVVFPLCRVRRNGFSRIEFAEVHVCDFSGPVFAADAIADCAAMCDLWAEVKKALPRCDFIHLEKLCPRIGDARNPLVWLPGLVACSASLWGLPLASVAPGELPATIKPAFAKRTIKREQRLARQHVRRYAWREELEELPGLFEGLLEIRLERFAGLGREELLTAPVWLDFYRSVVARDHTSVRVVLASLTADDQTIAAVLGFCHRGVFHYIMPTYVSENWNRHAPGFQLAFDLLRDCSRRGLRYFDLTIGDEPYKKAMGAERRVIYETRQPMSLKGWINYPVWRLRRAVRHMPRPPWRLPARKDKQDPA